MTASVCVCQYLCLQTTQHGGTRPLSQREKTHGVPKTQYTCIKCEVLSKENEYIAKTK